MNDRSPRVRGVLVLLLAAALGWACVELSALAPLISVAGASVLWPGIAGIVVGLLVPLALTLGTLPKARVLVFGTWLYLAWMVVTLIMYPSLYAVMKCLLVTAIGVLSVIWYRAPHCLM